MNPLISSKLIALNTTQVDDYKIYHRSRPFPQIVNLDIDSTQKSNKNLKFTMSNTELLI